MRAPPGGEEGESVGKGLGKSLSTSTGRGSIGEEPPAERYECRGNVASFPGPYLCVLVL